MAVKVGMVVGVEIVVGVKLIVGPGVNVGEGCTVKDDVIVNIGVDVGVRDGGERVIVHTTVGVVVLVISSVGVKVNEGVIPGVLVGGAGLIFPGEGISEIIQSSGVSVSNPIGYLASELPSGAAGTGG